MTSGSNAVARRPLARLVSVLAALAVLAGLAAPVRTQEQGTTTAAPAAPLATVRHVPPAQPMRQTGSWLERVLLEASQSAEPIAPARVGELLAKQYGPRLAALRFSRDPAVRLPRGTRVDLLAALVEERCAEIRFEVAQRGVPSTAGAAERVAWLACSGDAEGAHAAAAALDANDNSPAARVARVWSELHRPSERDDLTPLADELDQLRAEAQGVAQTLALVADKRFVELARLTREIAREYGDRAPAWARRALPPNEALEPLTRIDAAACAALVEEARGLPKTVVDGVDPADALLAAAAAADVLEPAPHLERARRALGRFAYEEALLAVDRALRRDPLDDAAWSIRAIAARALGDERGALLSAERALELNPGDPSCEERYVGALVRLCLIDEAAAYARAVNAYAPELPWCAIAVALADNWGSRSMFQDRRLAVLEAHLGCADDEASLWAAFALCLAKRTVDGAPRAVLQALAQQRADSELGRAAAALLADESNGTPFWSGAALRVRNRDWDAALLFRADAQGNDLAALRARGVLSFTDDIDATGWSSEDQSAGVPPVPAWTELTPLAVPILPDPCAVALRVPTEAATIEQALALLPPGSARIVVARGTHCLPTTIQRAATIVGTGTDPWKGTRLVQTGQWFNGCSLNAPNQSRVRFEGVNVNCNITHYRGDLALRRCQVLANIEFGARANDAIPASIELDHVVSNSRLQVQQAGGAVDVRDCVFAPTFDEDWTSSVSGAYVRIERSTFHAGRGRPAFYVDGPQALLMIADSVLIGAPARNGTFGSAVQLTNGARARFERVQAFDLEPLAGEALTVSDSTARRTRADAADVPGWTLTGFAVPPIVDGAAVVRVPGDFASLAEALLAAPDNATIELGAGLFEITFHLGRNVRIVGAGSGQTTVRTTGFNPSLSTQARIELEKLTLAHAGFDPSSGISHSPIGATLATETPIVVCDAGDVLFGFDVRVQGSLGVHVRATSGGVIRGRISTWSGEDAVYTSVDDQAAASFGLYPLLGGRVDARTLRRLPLAKSFARPVGVALLPEPGALTRSVEAQRLADLDVWFARFASVATGAQLADVAGRLWGLVPIGVRADEVLRRIQPRLEALARTDARAGVEELLTYAFSDDLPVDLGEGLALLSRSARAFRDAAPESERVFVEARLKGMSVAQADMAARTALFEEALAAGRIEQANALAAGLDEASRARVLVVTKPADLDYWKLTDLLAIEGLDDTTRQRLQILRDARQRDTRPVRSAPVSAWAALEAYQDALLTGEANQYFAFAETDRHGYWDVEVVALWDTSTGGSVTYGNPRPEPPQPGSNDAQWTQYYDALARWFP